MNYSLYFDKRLPGEAPNTIFDYFPEDMSDEDIEETIIGLLEEWKSKRN